MPTFQEAQTGAITLTEQEMKPLWNAVLNSYREAQKQIEAELAATYARVLAGVEPDDYYNELIKYDRLNKLLASVTAEYNKAARSAGANIAASSELAITNTYYRELYSLTWFSPSADVGLNFAFVDPRVVEASVFGTQEAWKAIQASALDKYGARSQYFPQAGSLTDLLNRNRTQELQQLQRTITSGLIQGRSYAQITQDVKDVIGRELVKDGRRAYTGAKANASRIVRTEGTRNLNAGFSASLHEAQAQGLEMQKEWDASLDGRTRPTHATADGQRVGLDENFVVGSGTGPFPGQINVVGEVVRCRCTHIAIIPGLEPQLRRGRNPVTNEPEVFSYKDFNTWAADNGLRRNSKGVLVKK